MESLKPNINNLVKLKLQTLHKKISKEDYKNAKDGKVKMPLLLTIEADDVEDESFRQGLDLVLVVDISGSMKGDKIKFVKDTLDFVIDELDEKDRISILTFNSNVKKLCGLKVMNKDNKKQLKEEVSKHLKPKGCTNIRKAMETAFNVLLERKEANDSTAIFLISDGQDTCGNNIEHIQKSMDAKISKMKAKSYDFQVHSFGYGDDHDEKVLDMISAGSNGKFYFIKTLSFIDECFIDCFGYLMSNFAKQIELEVHLANGVKFESVLTATWDKKSDRVALLNVPAIATGKSLEYTAEISIDIKKNPYKKDGKVKIGNVDLNFVSGTENFNFEAKLALEMVESNKEKDENNMQVEENFIKFEAMRVFEESKKKLEQGKQKESKWMVDDFLLRVDKKKGVRMGFKQKMKKHMAYENVNLSKNYYQVRNCLSNNVVNPDFNDMAEQAQVFNYRQRAMKSRKAKY